MCCKMIKGFKCKNIYMENGCTDGILLLENGRFLKVLPYDYNLKEDNNNYDILDLEERLIIPGIIDIHNHGFKGSSVCGEFKKPSKDELKKYLVSLATVGVTGVTPTASLEYFDFIADLNEEKYEGARILGIYSEGPFSTRSGENSSENVEYIEPSLKVAKEYIAKARGNLKIMSLAPEANNSEEVIKYLVEQGIIVAAYHTNANYEEMMKGFEDGITLVTHLGNVMRGIHHRDVGALGAALLDENMDCEIITDFYHLCPEMLKLMFKIKDYSKFILISDSMVLSGAEPGTYTIFGNYDLIVDENGYVKDKTGRLCGSSKYVLYGIKNIVEELQVPMEKALEMASLNPAKKLGIDHRKGSIAIGKDADFVIIDKHYKCIATYIEGEKAY